MSKKPYQVDVIGPDALIEVRTYVTKFNLAVHLGACDGGVSVYGPSAWAVGAAFANVGWEVRS